MTTQEKDLVLQDISGRLKYGVKCALCGRWEKKNGEDFKGYYTLIAVAIDKTWLDADNYPCLYSFERLSTPMDLTELKPYLRPITSMTDEEMQEYSNIDNRAYSCPKDYAHIPAKDRIDWLNEHHFDYRGLIEKGLAIKAPEGMYKFE